MNRNQWFHLLVVLTVLAATLPGAPTQARAAPAANTSSMIAAAPSAPSPLSLPRPYPQPDFPPVQPPVRPAEHPSAKAKLPPSEPARPPQPVQYLAALTAAPGTPDWYAARDALLQTLHRLQWNEQIIRFEWLDQANAFQVSAWPGMEATLGAKLAPPNLGRLLRYSPQAVQDLTAERTKTIQAAARPSAPTSFTPTIPQILEASLYYNYIRLSSSSDAATVITLTNAAGEYKAASSVYWSGSSPYTGSASLYGLDGNLQPGDKLLIAQEGQALLNLTVPDLRLHIDRDTDRITGYTPPVTTPGDDLSDPPKLWVQATHVVNHPAAAYASPPGKYITTDPSGDFTTVFTTTFPITTTYDLNASSLAQIYYTQADGNIFSLYTHAPYLETQLGNNMVYGYADPGTTITVTLKTATGIAKGQFISNALYGGYITGGLKSPGETNIAPQSGDRIEVAPANGQSFSLDLPTLTGLVNDADDTVSGVAPPNLTITDTNAITMPMLRIEMSSGGIQGIATGADGAYQVDHLGDIRPGDTGGLIYLTAAGDQVSARVAAPIVTVRSRYQFGALYEADSAVGGQINEANAVVRVTLQRGGQTIINAAAVSNINGQFWLYLRDSYYNYVKVEGGDVLTVSGPSSTRSVAVPTFTVQSNPDLSRITGVTNAPVITTTPGMTQTLAVWPADPHDFHYGQHVLPVTGVFTAINPFYPYADPMNPGTDLGWGPGNQGHLRYITASGDRVYQAFRAPYNKPLVSVRGSPYNNYVAENYVWGRVYGQCRSGSLVLRDSLNHVKSNLPSVYACSDFEAYFTDSYGAPVNILPGDKVEASFGGSTTLINVPPLTLIPDPGADIISGQAPGGITYTLGMPNSLYLELNNPYASTYVTTTLAGTYSVSFAPNDIRGGTSGFAYYLNRDFNYIYASFAVPILNEVTLIVRANSASSGFSGSNWLSGSVSDCNKLLTLRLKRAGKTLTTQAAYPCSIFSFMLSDANGAPLPILDGDVIEAEYGGEITTLTVPHIDITSDAKTNTLSGSIDAAVLTTTVGMTQTLAVWPTSASDNGFGRYVLPIAGVFSAASPFYYQADPGAGSNLLDWAPGDQGHARYITAQGHLIYSEFYALYAQPKLSIYKDSNGLSGYLAQPNAPAQVDLKTGSITRASTAVITDGSGYFWADLYDANGNPGVIQEGDDVVVTQGSLVTSVHIPRLTLNLNLAANTVSGQAPANSVLSVTSVPVISQADGSYSVDLTGYTTLSVGRWANVIYTTSAGHQVIVQKKVGPSLSMRLNTSYFRGVALEPRQPVTLTLTSGATVKGWAVVRSNSGQNFDGDLTSPTGQPVRISGGDVLTADFGQGRVHSMTAAALTLVMDPVQERLSGTGPANSLLYQFYPGNQTTLLTAADGSWSREMASLGVDVAPGDKAEVSYTDAAQNDTWLIVSLPVLYVRGSSAFPSPDNASSLIAGIGQPYMRLNITLQRGNATLFTQSVATQDPTGWFMTNLSDPFNRLLPILAGDKLLLNGAISTTLVVPPLSASFDPATHTLNGTGPLNASLGITRYANGYDQQPTLAARTNGAGAFSLSLPDAQPGDTFDLRYVTPAGHWVHQLVRTSETPQGILYARWANNQQCNNCIHGYQMLSSASFRLELHRNGSLLAKQKGWTTDSGDFDVVLQTAAQQPIDLLAGDQIFYISQGQSVSMTVAALTAQFNPDSQVIYGAAPANTQVNVQWSDLSGTAGGSDIVITGPDGRYNVPAAMARNGQGQVYTADPNRNRTYVGFASPMLIVQELGNTVMGFLTRMNAPVTLRLLNAAGSEKAHVSTTTSLYSAQLQAQFIDAVGRPILIQPNDQVVIEETDPQIIPVVPLELSIDPASDQVSGKGPANHRLIVRTEQADCDLLSGADGSFNADFSGRADLQAGDYARVSYIDEHGNEIFIEQTITLVRVNPTADLVDGYATPNVTASLVLKRAGATLGTAAALTSEDGFFSVFFTDAAGALEDIQPGDTVEVTASPTAGFTVSQVSAAIDLAADKVAGKAPPNSLVSVTAWAWDAEDGWLSDNLSALVNASGDFSADFSTSFDLTADSYASVRSLNADGHETIINTLTTHSPMVDNLADALQDNSARLVISSFGTANEGDLTPPLRFTHTGGKLIFSAYGGALVVTTPDGSQIFVDDHWLAIPNAAPGQWKVQVRSWADYYGEQYAIAVGKVGLQIYLPVIQK